MSGPRSLPVIWRSDIRALLREVWDGVVPSGDLYRTYLAQMKKQGREPVTHNALGRALAACAQRRVSRSVEGKNVRCWVIRIKFMGPEDRDDEEVSPRL